MSEVADLLGRPEGLWKKLNLTLTLAEFCSSKKLSTEEKLSFDSEEPS